VLFDKKTYVIGYPVQCGWGVMCEEYECKAHTKRGAFKNDIHIKR
jgi:hypothetical protein